MTLLLHIVVLPDFRPRAATTPHLTQMAGYVLVLVLLLTFPLAKFTIQALVVLLALVEADAAVLHSRALLPIPAYPGTTKPEVIHEL